MKHTTKTMQALDMHDNYELEDMLAALREDVNDVLTIRIFDKTRNEMLTLLAKANLIRKYADNCQPIALSANEFFAHNGIAWDYVSGAHACDSFNLADVWSEFRDKRILAKNAIGVATLDGDGLHWLYGGLPLPSDKAIGVSNLHWHHYL